MKIVEFEEFVCLPEGTVYSEYEPTIATGLFVREKVILNNIGDPIDFFYKHLHVEFDDFEEGDIKPAFQASGNRWGEFDYNAQFVIWESEDIERLIGHLQTTLGGAK